MISKWYELKSFAVGLRQEGISIGNIEKKLGIPRSTLSGWFKNINLSNSQKEALIQRWREGLVNARKKAVIWHNAQKMERLNEAETYASSILDNIDVKNKYILELALSMLYLGEGSKKNQTSMGNSNPEILRFFLKSMNLIYGIDTSTIKCYLHLRSDQKGKELIRFWSQELHVPVGNFSFIKDKRTVKSKTYSGYKGVCVVHAGRIDILRKLAFINSGFCAKILAL